MRDFSSRDRLLKILATNPPKAISNHDVIHSDPKDGYKFRLADQSWLLIRFSGTEPVLRLYSEAVNPKAVQEILAWAQTWAEAADQAEG